MKSDNLLRFSGSESEFRIETPLTIASMYGIFTNIYHRNRPSVGKYTVHGIWDLHLK